MHFIILFKINRPKQEAKAICVPKWLETGEQALEASKTLVRLRIKKMQI